MDNPGSKTLLFAEDEPELLEIFTGWFEPLGYKTLTATNAKEALAICRNERVDLVISDVRMAGGDGMELARELKATFENSPLLVFLTGYADLSNEEAYDLGACAILNKPINRQELRSAITRFLKSSRELWEAPATVEPKARFQKEFESLTSALQRRALSLGRGGMFVRDCEWLPEDVPVAFQFRFDDKQVPKMEGCGILRWQRAFRQEDLPAGVGVEILHLDAPALDPVVNWISHTRPRSFIPKQ